MVDKTVKDESSVAYDLMFDIANAEVENNGGGYPQLRQNNPRKYFLELYAECATAVKHQILPDSYDSEK